MRRSAIDSFIFQLWYRNNKLLTRKSFCVNARGIPTAAYQVLHLLSCRGGGGTHLGYPPIRPGRGVTPSWVSPYQTWLGYPPPQHGWGTPLARSGRGGPEVVYAPAGMGYPLAGGTPPPPAGPGQGTFPGWTWPGTPVDRQTDTCQNITFPSYYLRGR